jgi:hypothetical protein
MKKNEVTIHPEDITMVKMYILSISEPIFIKQTLLNIKALIDFNKIMVVTLIPHSHQ